MCVLWNLQNSSTTQGRLEEAMPLRERCLQIVLKVLGPDHPQVAASLNNKAVLLKKMVSC